jgi:hypothetical protein
VFLGSEDWEPYVNNRVLGTIAIICAPALLIEGLLLRGQENNVVSGIAGMVFMAGWICSNIGMQRMRATGNGTWGRAVLIIQLVGLVLAFLFGFVEATGLLDENNGVFNVLDAAWPLSMLWMLVVGITVIVARRLSGWQRYVPLLCPFWLPIALFLAAAFGEWAGLIGLAYAAVLWGLLGYIVLLNGDSRQQATPASRSRVR